MIKEPAYRFRGYTDAWEQRKLGEVVKRVSKTTENLELPTVEYEDVISGEGRLNKNIFEKVSDKKGISFQNGDVLFGKLRPYLQNWLLANFEGIAVGDWWVLRSSELESSFIYSYIQTNNYQTVANLSTGTKMPRSDWKVVSDSELYFPTLAEQTAIGNFFQTLDRSIALHQRKLDSLKEQKKTYLQKLFPRNGENIPEIRFPEFQNAPAWEQRKLGEYFTERKERSDKGELISVTINEGIKKFSELERKDNSSQDKSNYKVVKQGDIAYNSMRMWQGASGLSPYDGIVSPAYTVITPTSLSNSEFFSYNFKREELINQFQVNSQGLTSDTWNLKFTPFSQIKTLAPTLAEQTAIGTFFQTLDRSIALHQRKLDKLKESKQTLLKKMFI